MIGEIRRRVREAFEKKILYFGISQFVENVTIHFQYYIIVTGYYFGEYQKQAWVFVGEISSSISKKEIESGG